MFDVESFPPEMRAMIGVGFEVFKERDNQNKHWGEQNHDDPKWFLILSEEVGEVATEILEAAPGHEERTREELVQVAAVAMAMIECIDRRNEEQA